MTWMKAALAAELPVGAMLHVEAEDDDIALYHLEEGFYATSDVCTHAGELLTGGKLKGDVVACPKHGGKFSVKTGKAVAFPCVYALQTYPVELRDGEVWIDI